MRIFTNHFGYLPNSPKIAIVQAPAGLEHLPICLQDCRSKQPLWRGKMEACGPVDQWRDWYFYRVDFSTFAELGHFEFKLLVNDQPVASQPFEIRQGLFTDELFAAVVDYFGMNRCAGDTDQWDHSVGFVDTPDKPRVDVHGGWYDASGDWSKYLSHLSYANYLNPQQIPMVVWSMQDCLDDMPRPVAGLKALMDEMLFGADFLVRMQDPEGYFYTTIFDVWSKDKTRREICAYQTQKGTKTTAWQAGYRQGGGMAIAALARAYRFGQARDFEPQAYLQAAITGFDHLETHNLNYLDDGQENVIDDYCALMAALELYQSQPEPRFAEAAHRRAANLHARLSQDEQFQGWLRADDQGQRPYSHCAEEGLPIIAMLQYAQRIPDANQQWTHEFVQQQLTYWLQVSTRVNNPFLYPRHYCKPLSTGKQDQFFFTHDNESGYWWQGENARLASMASACLRSLQQLNLPSELAEQTRMFAYQQWNWLLGLNPFSACMVQGFGYNNPFYRADWPGHTGGVCNGITSSLTNEHDIALCETDDPFQNWRWGEQWIPHGAWFLLLLKDITKEQL